MWETRSVGSEYGKGAPQTDRNGMGSNGIDLNPAHNFPTKEGSNLVTGNHDAATSPHHPQAPLFKFPFGEGTRIPQNGAPCGAPGDDAVMGGPPG
jgi:hypothetical protein